MTDTPKRKRRWLQFSLRSLLIFTVLCAIAAGWLGRKIEHKRREHAAVDAIRKHGGTVDYDYNDGNKPDGPAWIRSLLGDNFFNEVRAVHFYGADATDDSLRSLEGLTRLQEVDLGLTKQTNVGVMRVQQNHLRVSDAGLLSLKGLTNLRYLFLDGAQVTDAGIENLKGLTQLKRLGLFETKVTNTGVASLNAALPNCLIYR